MLLGIGGSDGYPKTGSWVGKGLEGHRGKQKGTVGFVGCFSKGKCMGKGLKNMRGEWARCGLNEWARASWAHLEAMLGEDLVFILRARQKHSNWRGTRRTSRE